MAGKNRDGMKLIDCSFLTKLKRTWFFLNMENFIIRLYRFEKDNPRTLVGLVEKPGKERRIGFTTMDELWEILNSSIGEKMGEDRDHDKGGDGLKKERNRRQVAPEGRKQTEGG